MKILCRGGSMRPVLKNGKIIEVKGLEGKKERKEAVEGDGRRATGNSEKAIRKGDVVLYKRGEAYFIHRVVGISREYKMNDDSGIVGEHYVGRDEIAARIPMPWYGEGGIGLWAGSFSRVFFRAGRRIKRLLEGEGKPGFFTGGGIQR